MFKPLKLTPFEWVMLQYAGQGAPPTFFIDLHLRGVADAGALRAATLCATRRHALLCAHVCGAGPRTLRWIPAADSAPHVDFAAAGVPCCFPKVADIDLREHTGLRVWARFGDDTTLLRFQFHHACCDGLGAFRFIEDLLCAYHLEMRGADSGAVFRPIDPQRLRMRRKIAVERTARAGFATRTRAALQGAVSFFRDSPTSLSSRDVAPSDTRQRLRLPALASHTFTRQQTRRLRERAVRAGGSSYAVLLRDLMCAIAKWNGTPQHADESMIRIMAPISMRSPADTDLPAMNRVSMVRIDRVAAWRNDPERLLASITGELAQIVRLGRDRTLHRVAALGAAFPPLPWILRRKQNRCCATSVLSSGGKVFTGAKLPRRNGKLVSGGLVLERIDGAPPVSPYTPVVFGCLWYAGELTLTANYHQPLFTSTAAQQLLDTFVQCVQSSAATVQRRASGVGDFVETLPDILEATLADQLIPDAFGVLPGRDNGNNAGATATGHRPTAER